MAIKIRKVGSGVTEGFEVWTDEPFEQITFSEKVRAIRQHVEDMIQHEMPAEDLVDLARIIRRCDLLLEAMDDGDLERTGFLAFELGERWGKLSIKCDWEDHALRGRRIAGAAVAGGLARGGLNDTRDREMAEEFRRRRGQGGKSDTAVKKEIGRERGLKRSAAIAAIGHGLKISSG